jgi:hypothetical protein
MVIKLTNRKPIAKPLKITPLQLTSSSLGIVSPPQSITARGQLMEINDAPRCSLEKVVHYRDNWEKILAPKVLKKAKKHNDVIHGAWSVNQQVPKRYRRPTGDIDVWSKKPYERAQEIEDELDESVGCDIAYLKEQKLPPNPNTLVTPPRSLREIKETDGFRRVVVETVSQVGQADYASFPSRPFRAKRIKGVRHETIASAYDRAEDLLQRPGRYGRAYEDIERIDRYREAEKRKRKRKKKKVK